MAYTITDIAELVEYHLVASAPNDDAAHSNLVQLVQQLEVLAPRPLYREAPGSSATAARARSIPTSSTRTATTTPTMATSSAPTAGRRRVLRRETRRPVRSARVASLPCDHPVPRLRSPARPARGPRQTVTGSPQDRLS